jgi:DNA polymerase-3 subunit delta
MRLYADRLASSLTQCPRAVLICGDELLLIEESLDLVRRLARAEGFDERESFFVEREKEFNFNAALENAGTLSLFARRRIQEWRFTQMPGDAGKTALQQLVSNADADTCLVAIVPGLQKKQLDAAWVQAFEQHGQVIIADPVSSERLNNWIVQRAKSLQLQLHSDAVQALVEYTEGNLLATQQTLQQLVLLYPQQLIHAEAIHEVCSQQARFDVYAVVDTALSGDSARVLRMLAGLRNEDDNGYLRQLLAAVQRDLRTLDQVAQLIEVGQSPNTAAQNAKVWFKRQAPFAVAAKRLQTRGTRILMKLAFDAERAMKGGLIGDPWQMLEKILLRCAGVRV